MMMTRELGLVLMPRCEAPRRHPHTLELQNTSHIRLVSPADVSGLSVSTQTSRDGVGSMRGWGITSRLTGCATRR